MEFVCESKEVEKNRDQELSKSRFRYQETKIEIWGTINRNQEDDNSEKGGYGSISSLIIGSRRCRGRKKLGFIGIGVSLFKIIDFE